MADAEERAPMARNGGSRPVPDPTELTDRAIARLEKTLTLYVDGKLDMVEERLRGIDEATKLRRDQVVDIHRDLSSDVDKAVAASERVLNERFGSIDKQFIERDTRAESSKLDSQKAVDAAFAAQKEAAAKQDEANAKAIDKSERATAETIKTNLELTKATTDTLTKDVDALKLAVNTILSTKVGNTEERRDRTDNRVALYTTIGLIVTLVLFGFAIVGFLASRGGTP
jgi:hypothetical protein